MLVYNNACFACLLHFPYAVCLFACYCLPNHPQHHAIYPIALSQIFAPNPQFHPF
jgi:hypothetical protein